jgi:ABC-type dipeptide/oligopeptide/nickel transport system permease subunit
MIHESTKWRRFTANKAAFASLSILVILVAVAILLPWAADLGDPNRMDLANALAGPSWSHPFGTDQLGRDIAVRIIYGARISLLYGIGAAAFGVIVALPVGLVTSYIGGRTDMITQRIVDVLFAFPPFLLALAFVAVLGTGLVNVIIAVGASTVPPMVRLIRSGVLAVKGEDYISSARAVGCSNLRIIVRHILPNIIGPITVQATLYIGLTIIAAAGLGFLGLGVQPPAAEWGTMLGESRDYIFNAPHLLAIPGLAIFMVVLAFNYVGDGLRDMLDPRAAA